MMSESLDEIANLEFESMKPSRREFIVDSLKFFAAVSLSTFLPSSAEASLNISNDFSPINRMRRYRPRTEYIILHTTENSDKSSLNSVKEKGSTNYLVLTNGSVKRIIDKDKIANHAGRSMWEGRRNLNKWSIGIEVVGYHNKPITNAQYHSLKELLDELQRTYNIPDEDVLPHSMVAYGKPNRWHSYNHRGRKRCGMLFALPKVRKRLGLKKGPSYDPDVTARRLRVADSYLNNILFGKGITEQTLKLASVGNTITKKVTAWAIARDQYNAPTTRYTFPDGTIHSGNQINNWDQLPTGTKVAMNIGGSVPDNIEYFQRITGNDTAWKIAGKEYNAPTTIYFIPDGRVRRGDQLSKQFLNHIPRGTEVLTGYTYGGKVTRRRSAMKIAGRKWDDLDTFYRLPTGKIISGEDINQRQIPRKTIIFFRNDK